jgi:ATP-binding cassette, subfamily B, bacterial
MGLLLTYLARHKRTLAAALVLATINQSFSLLEPQVTRIALDRYLLRIDELARYEFLRGVGLLMLATVTIAFISRVAKNFQDYYVNVTTQKIGANMYADSVAHTFALPFAVFEDQRSGELLGKLQKARTDSQVLVNSMINIIFVSTIGMIIVLAYSYYVHWAVGLAYTIAAPVLAAVTFMLSRRLRALQKSVVTQVAELAGSTTETIRNVELVKSLGLEAQETTRLNVTNEAILKLELKKVRLTRALSFIQGTFINALRTSLVFLLFWLVYQRAITIGEYMSLMFYSFFLFGPLQELGTISTQYQEARGSMEVLGQVLSLPPQPKPADAQVVGRVERIEYKGVRFGYQPGVEVLKGIDLTIRRGEAVAFVGPSGSGKTTLVKLLLGLYTPAAGSIEFNGIPSTAIDYEALRSRVGYVSQDTQLFAGTIRENLRFVQPQASDEECLAALRQARVLQIIERGDKGLDTKIGEGGIKLSGGEKQRLAIARSLLRRPEIIVFDEATSSLDSLTEREIMATIEDIVAASPHLITVFIAHRLSTVAGCDRIHVMERGALVEAGGHADLLQRGGMYAALWRSQGGAIDAERTREPATVG